MSTAAVNETSLRTSRQRRSSDLTFTIAVSLAHKSASFYTEIFSFSVTATVEKWPLTTYLWAKETKISKLAKGFVIIRLKIDDTSFCANVLSKFWPGEFY